MAQVTLEKLEELSYGKKEAFNSLRTNLGFCGEDICVIAFTSCTPDEGKSSTVMELARAYAENGKRVLLMDADLRKSVLIGRHRAHREVGIKETEIEGLTHYLAGKAELQSIINTTNVQNMDMIFAGHTTPNPTELLDGERFHELMDYARTHYDMVLLDTPPLGSVIDTAVIAPNCDGAVIVTEAGKCSYQFVREIKKQLEVTGVRILGTVLNKVQVEKGGYYNRYYKGYYKGYYDKYYGTKEK